MKKIYAKVKFSKIETIVDNNDSKYINNVLTIIKKQPAKELNFNIG
jgi:hypothetical protein